MSTIAKCHFLKNQIDENSDISIECLDVMCRRNIKDIELINENLFTVENQKLKFSAIDNSIKYDYKSKILLLILGLKYSI